MHNLKEIRPNLKNFEDKIKQRNSDIDISYNKSNGIAKPICVTGSGGVKIAATAKIITTTYFLLFFKYSESINPTLANKLKITGS